MGIDPPRPPHDVTPVYHVITPGDHFSPRTGSAIPTVVHGLASGAARVHELHRFPQNVVIDATTFRPRYTSAAVIEYDGAPAPGARRRLGEMIAARAGRPRTGSLDHYRPAADALAHAAPGVVLAHNAPILMALLRGRRHHAYLYAHNNVLRTYGRAETGRVLDGCAGIIAVSDALAAQLSRHLPPRLRAAMTVVRNGVDPDMFFPGARRDRPTTRVLFLGRVIPDKGADILLDAARRVGRPDVEYVIVGSHGFSDHDRLSRYEQRLRRQAATVTAGRVRFEPFVDRERIPALLRDADVLVVPSRWPDPCPLTIGEGLASGLVVVASRVGGIPEILGDAGILVEEGRPAQLAEVLRALIDDPSERARYRERALRHTRSHGWDRTWRDLETALVR